MDVDNGKSPLSHEEHHYERLQSNNENKEIGIHENIQYNENGQINAVEYVYEEQLENTNEIKRYHAILRKDQYEQMIQKNTKFSFPFEIFIRIFRPFIMGKYAAEHIEQAFQLLDQDKSGYIDLSELSLFIPLIRPDANPHLIIHYIQKKDLNQDYKLNYQEFSSLILSGIGRDVIIGRL